jgi:two-component system sensor histidine kinase AtoS
MDNLEEFLSALTKMVAEVFEVSWVSVSVLNQTSGRNMIKATYQKQEYVGLKKGINRADSSAFWLKDHQRLISRRLLDEFGSQITAELKYELNKEDTFISQPLFAGEKLIGVLNLGQKTDNQLFDKDDLTILSEIGELIAGVVNQAVNYCNVSEQKLHHQDILDNLVSGIIAIDPHERITVFNRTAKKILKFKSGQVLGRDVHILQTDLVKLLLNTLHEGTSYHREEVYVMPENILIGVSTSQFYDEQGELSGACMVFSSLSEVKKKEKLVRQQNLNAYWSNVANSLAHEVKNSITATKAFTEMFPKKYEDEEFRLSLYSTLKRDMEELDRFSEHLLNFAQSQKLFIQPCHIDEVVEEAIDSVVETIDIGEIAIEKRFSQNLQLIPADYHRLKEAFSCMINNALEAMGKKGKLSISIEKKINPEELAFDMPEATNELPEGEVIVVKIADTGSGILPQDLPYLFDPFFTTKTGRAGLGLSTARKIIESHQGVINVQSQPNEGSLFCVCLPLESKGKASE